MAEERKVIIGANTEDYTGYSQFIMIGTSNASVDDLSFEGTITFPISEQPHQKESETEYLFPETREEKFLDENLLKFYQRKGISVNE